MKIYISSRRQAFVVVLGLLLTACGGGGGSNAASDTIPEQYLFIDQVDIRLNVVSTSNSITIAGIDTSSPISVSGGEYSINGGAFTSTADEVVNGQVIVVRQTSSSNFSVTSDAILTVGGVSDTYSVTTISEDVVPDQFIFTDQTNVPLSSIIQSNSVTVVGINSNSPISVVGGEYSIDGGAFTSAAGSIVNGQSIVVRQTSSINFSATTNATLTVGGVSDTLSVTTISVDVVPDQFIFTDQIEVQLSSIIQSNSVSVMGINSSAPISIVGGEYSIDGGTFTSTAGFILNEQIVQIRQASANNLATTTDALLSIGGVNDTFSVTTIVDDITPDQFSFFDQISVQLDSVIQSNSVTVSGISTGVSISIQDGEYSINGSAFISISGFVQNGQVVVVRQTSSSNFSTITDAVLTIGSVSDTFSVTTLSDNLAPTAAIEFPPPFSVTEIDDANIVVTGTAQDNSLISTIRVNDVDATSTNGFETWQVNIQLVQGMNNITVETLDTSGNSNSTATTAEIIYKGPELPQMIDLVHDSVNNRLLIMTGKSSLTVQLIEIDLTTNARRIISTSDQSGGGNTSGVLFSNIKSMVLDSANGRVIVLDSGNDALVEVNLLNGFRTIISDVDVGTGPVFVNPTDFAFDSINDRIFVTETDFNNRAILSVDLTTGNRTVVSNLTVGTGDFLFGPTYIVYDGANNRVVVLDQGQIKAVDVTTGNRSVVITPARLGGNVQDIVFDAASSTFYVTDRNTLAVWAVDLQAGTTNIISDATTGTGEIFTAGIRGIDLDSSGSVIYLCENSSLDRIFTIDISTGNRNVILDSRVGIGQQLVGSNSIGIAAVIEDTANERYLVVDNGYQGVYAIDNMTGNRSIFSNNTTGAGINLSTPVDIVLDSLNNRALVLDSTLDAVIEVNLSNGDRTIISDSTNGTGTVFSSPISLDIDSNENLLYIVDDQLDAVFMIDLVTGNRTIISDATIGSGITFSRPSGIVKLPNQDTLIVVDRQLDSVFSVDLLTGDRIVISDSSTGGGFAITELLDVAVNSRENMLYVLDGFPGRNILRINLQSGLRELLTNIATGEGPIVYSGFKGISFNNSTGRMLMILNDSTLYNHVRAVDVFSGDHVLITK
mgnify:CR=1 FL=1